MLVMLSYWRTAQFTGSAFLAKKYPCEAEVRVVAAMLEPIKTSIWINRVLESMTLGEIYTKGTIANT